GKSRLFLGGALVKQFRQDAPAQKAILTAFQEEGWGPWIHNPLPAQGDRDGEERLHDAVNKLNRGQQQARLHFRVEGGERVYWGPRAAKRGGTQAAPKRHRSGT